MKPTDKNNNIEINKDNSTNINDKTRAIQKVTLGGLFVNMILAIFKFLAGFFAHSQALVADAVHSLTDSATDVAVLIGAPRWTAPADDRHPHGHGRIETLITFGIGIVLGFVGIGLIYNALTTLQAEQTHTPGWAAFAVACFSIVSKEFMYRWNIKVGRKYRSTAVLANAWHHRSDALSSLPVAIVVMGTKIQPQLTFLDPIGALVVSVFILQAAWKIFYPALNQLTDASASKTECRKVHEIVNNVAEVKEVHALRTRHIGTGLQIDLHIIVDGNMSVHEGHEIARKVKWNLINDGPEVVDVLVHVEPDHPRFIKKNNK